MIPFMVPTTPFQEGLLLLVPPLRNTVIPSRAPGTTSISSGTLRSVHVALHKYASRVTI